MKIMDCPKEIFSIILMAGLFFFARPVSAGAVVIPVLTEPCEPGSGWVCIVQRLQSWYEEPSAANPCYGWSSCYVGLDVSYLAGTGGELGNSCSVGSCIEISKYRTAREVAEAWQSQKGIPFTTNRFGLGGNGDCVGLMYIQTPGSGMTRGTLWPNSVCGKIPPVNTQCNISVPSQINYGTLSSSEVDGQSKSINGNVSCNKNVTVKIIALSSTGEEDVYLSSDKSLYSGLNINGANAASGVNVSASPNASFTLGSVLHKTGELKGGVYSGNAVVILTFS